MPAILLPAIEASRFNITLLRLREAARAIQDLPAPGQVKTAKIYSVSSSNRSTAHNFWDVHERQTRAYNGSIRNPYMSLPHLPCLVRCCIEDMLLQVSALHFDWLSPEREQLKNYQVLRSDPQEDALQCLHGRSAIDHDLPKPQSHLSMSAIL